MEMRMSWSKSTGPNDARMRHLMRFMQLKPRSQHELSHGNKTVRATNLKTRV